MNDSSTDIIKVIEDSIKEDFYKQFANDGNRFVAWYLKTIYSIPESDVERYLTDGKDDKQIDAIFVDDETELIHIIQGKYYTGRQITSEPLMECLSAVNQLTDLESLEERANQKLKNNLLALNDGLNDGYKVIMEFITTGIIPENVKKEAESIQSKISDIQDLDAELQIIDIPEMALRYDEALGKNESEIDQLVHLVAGDYLKMNISGVNVVIASIPLNECVRFEGIQDGRLFKKNVRQSLGSNNKVNKNMAKSITDAPEDFFFMHNGITAICTKMILNEKENTLMLNGLSIINGCQSMTTFFNNKMKIQSRSNACVLFRFYEIRDDTKADAITKATNSQSAVKPRDLRSIDPNIIKLKNRYESKYPGAYLLTKRGECEPRGCKKGETIDIVGLGKTMMSWYVQRPNIAYSESKIFDAYFDTIFGRKRLNDNTPDNIHALILLYKLVWEKWEDKNNPLNIDKTLFLKPRYMVYHHIYAISVFVGLSNESSLVPKPSTAWDLLESSGLLNTVVRKSANALNKAYKKAKARADRKEKAFLVENWMKNNDSWGDISEAIIDIIEDDLADDAPKEYSKKLAMPEESFEPRWEAKD